MSIKLDTTMKDMQTRMRLLLQNRKKTALDVSNFMIPSGSVPNIVSKWIKGEANLTAKKIMAAVEILDTSVDFMFLGKGSNIKMSELYSPILNIDEKDLFVNFQNMSEKNKNTLLEILKQLVPKNTFDKTNFVERNHGDFEQADKELREVFLNFGKRLKALLKERKIKQKIMSEDIGMHPALCSKIVQGERIISTEMLAMVCQYLDVVPSDLLCNYVEPDKIEGFDKKASDLIVYYRMLSVFDKGKILAISKAILEEIQVNVGTLRT